MTSDDLIPNQQAKNSLSDDSGKRWLEVESDVLRVVDDRGRASIYKSPREGWPGVLPSDEPEDGHAGSDRGGHLVRTVLDDETA